jgi:hypothetical protein
MNLGLGHGMSFHAEWVLLMSLDQQRLTLVAFFEIAWFIVGTYRKRVFIV